jgi:hypothetical protein
LAAFVKSTFRKRLKTPLVLLCHRFFWATDYRVKSNAALAKARISFVSSKSSNK